MGALVLRDDRRYLTDLLSGGPAELSTRFLEYRERLRGLAHRRPSPWGEPEEGPYWRQLPRWLVESKRGSANTLPDGFLDTIDGGQSAIFYAIRLQDDIVDKQVKNALLALAPPRLLTGAERAFSRLMEPDAMFWHHFRRSVHATIAGIVRVWELQHDPDSSPEILLDAYGSVDAIFSVGSAAVCEKLRLMSCIPRIRRFVGELGKVLLALDDADDIEEDLDDGRFNYVAKMLLCRLGRSVEGVEQLKAICRNQVRQHDFEEIKVALGHCLDCAQEAAVPLELQPVSELIEETRAEVENL